MRLDIFFGDDIRNALLAADEASTATARACVAAGGDPTVLRAYLEGYRAALTTVALAFGLEPGIIFTGATPLRVLSAIGHPLEKR